MTFTLFEQYDRHGRLIPKPQGYVEGFQEVASNVRVYQKWFLAYEG